MSRTLPKIQYFENFDHKMAIFWRCFGKTRGAMHQKIAIFKEENSVWCGTKFSNITKWHYFLDELDLKLKNKTCQEISKITKWHYFLDELNLKLKNKYVIIIFDKYIFWDSWQKLVESTMNVLQNFLTCVLVGMSPG